MIAFVEQLTREAQSGGSTVTREVARKAAAVKPKIGRPKAFVFQYRPPTKTFNLKLHFRKSDVEPSEVIATLEAILAELRRGR